MKKSVLILATSILLLSACTQVPAKTVSAPPSDKTATVLPVDSTNTTTTTQEVPQTPPTATTTVSYTAADVAQHNSETSCWLILSGKVYDVTKFIPSHPGGEKILRWCGVDATQMFARHPESAKALKEQFYIGDLKQ